MLNIIAAVAATVAVAQPVPSEPRLEARSLAIAGQHGEALDILALAIQQHPDDMDLKLERARILFWSGRFDDARAQVEAIKRNRPGYPGVAALADQIDRARIGRESPDAPIAGLSAGVTYSDVKQGDLDTHWSTIELAGYRGLTGDVVAGLSINREKRASTDIQITARIEGGAKTQWSLSASHTGNADFRPDWAAQASLTHTLGNVTLGGSYRHAEYSDNRVDIIRPEASIRLSQALYKVTTTAILVHDQIAGTMAGGAMRFDLAPDARSGAFAAVARYPEAEFARVRQTSLFAAGARRALSGSIDLHIAAEHERRTRSYRRSAITIALTYRFGR